MLRKVCLVVMMLVVLVSSSVYVGYGVSSFTPDPGVLAAYQSLQDMVNNSDLSHGIKSNLLSPLSASQTFYKSGTFASAVNSLESFKSKVITLVKDKKGQTAYSELSAKLISGANNIETSVELNDHTVVKIGATDQAGSTTQTEALRSLALEDANSWARSVGSQFRFTLTTLDNQGSDAIALLNTQYFHEHGIDLVVGHSTSSMCASSISYANLNNVLLFSPSSTSAQSVLVQDDNLFRLTPNDAYQSKVILDAYAQLGISSVVVLCIDNNYGRGIEEAIRGSSVSVLKTEAYDYQDPQIESHLANLEARLQGEDLAGMALQIATYQDVDTILNLLTNYPKLSSLMLIGCDGTVNWGFYGEGIYSATWGHLYSPMATQDLSNPLFVALQDRYRRITGEDLPFYSAAQYDIIMIYAKATNRAGSANPSSVRDAIKSIVNGYQGASGVSTLDKFGDRIGGDYDIWGYGYKNGVFVSERCGKYVASTDTLTIDTNYFDKSGLQISESSVNTDTWRNINSIEVVDHYSLTFWARVFSIDRSALDSFRVLFDHPINGLDHADLQLQGDGSYAAWMDVSQVVTGTFTIEAKSGSSTTSKVYIIGGGDYSQAICTVTTPLSDELFKTSDSLSFNAYTDLAGVNNYWVDVWDDGGNHYFGRSSNTLPVTYDGASLNQGRYHYCIICSAVGPQIATFGDFYIGSDIQLLDSNVWTSVWVDFENPGSGWVTINGWTRTLTTPEGVKLVHPTATGDVAESVMSLQEDGSWYGGVDLPSQVYGEVKIKATKGEDTQSAVFTLGSENYATGEMSLISPLNGEVVKDGGSLVFSWSTTQANVVNYDLYMWGNDGLNWQGSSDNPSIAYSGDTLAQGQYWANLHMRTSDNKELYGHLTFYIGSEIQMIYPRVWSTVWRNFETPGDDYVTINAWALLPPLTTGAAVRVIYPGVIHDRGGNDLIDQQLTPGGSNDYYCGVETKTHVAGDFTLESSKSGEAAQYVTLHIGPDDYATENIILGSPLNGQVFTSSDGLEFSWSADQPKDISGYEVNVWDSSGYYWSTSSPVLPISYAGDPLATGQCWARLIMYTNNNQDLGAYMTFTIDPSAKIVFHVHDQFGNPLEGVTVWDPLREFGGGWDTGKGGLTDASGTFTMSGLDPVAWNVVVQKSGLCIMAANVVLSAGETKVVDFTLYPEAFIKGTFKDNGKPIVGMEVDASTPSIPFGYSVWTDASGAFSIGWLPPGTYSIRAQKPGTDGNHAEDWVTLSNQYTVAAGQTIRGVMIRMPK